MRIVRPRDAAGLSPSAAPLVVPPRAEHHRPLERLPKLANPTALAPTGPRATEALVERVEASLGRTALQLRGLQESSGAWNTPFVGGSFHLALSWLASAVVDAPIAGADTIIAHFKREQRADGGFSVTNGDIPAATATRMVILALRQLAKREPRLTAETRTIIDKARDYLATVHKHDDTLFCAIVDLLAATLDPEEAPSLPNLGLVKTMLSSYMTGTVSGLAHVYLPAVVLLAANHPTLGAWPRMFLGAEGVAKLEGEIQARQDPDGGWGWTDLGSALSMIALHARGHRLPSSEPLARGQEFLAGLRETHPAAWTRGDAWDTGFVALTLQMLGDEAPAERGVARLLETQRSDGRWSFSLTGKLGDNDTSSTALRAVAARHAKTDEPEERARLEKSMRAAVRGLLDYQQSSGGWGAFNKSGLGSGRYPPIDSNTSAIDDTASPDLTARVVRSLTSVRDSG
ncbi:MAG TPA: hypothetical protein VLC93_15775, partial [Myxococcota bacterium]|nr:hypothetical protein [Myxococcota bacterium]